MSETKNVLENEFQLDAQTILMGKFGTRVQLYVLQQARRYAKWRTNLNRERLRAMIHRMERLVNHFFFLHHQRRHCHHRRP